MPGSPSAPQPGPALVVQTAVLPPPLGTELSGLLFSDLSAGAAPLPDPQCRHLFATPSSHALKAAITNVEPSRKGPKQPVFPQKLLIQNASGN